MDMNIIYIYIYACAVVCSVFDTFNICEDRAARAWCFRRMKICSGFIRSCPDPRFQNYSGKGQKRELDATQMEPFFF